jgi:ClpX C4-type zinc finger
MPYDAPYYTDLGLDPGLFACRMQKEFEAEARCSFCRLASPEVRSLIKSMNDDNVCNTCLDALLAAISDFYAPNTGGSDATCMFCERASPDVHQMVKLGVAGPAICSDCVIACHVTLREYETALADAGMIDRWDMGYPTPWD